MSNHTISPLDSSANTEKISMTVKAVVAVALIVIKSVFGIDIVSEQVDRIIESIVTLVCLYLAVSGYFRAKKVMGSRIMSLEHQLGKQK